MVHETAPFTTSAFGCWGSGHLALSAAMARGIAPCVAVHTPSEMDRNQVLAGPASLGPSIGHRWRAVPNETTGRLFRCTAAALIAHDDEATQAAGLCLRSAILRDLVL